MLKGCFIGVSINKDVTRAYSFVLTPFLYISFLCAVPYQLGDTSVLRGCHKVATIVIRVTGQELQL